MTLATLVLAPALLATAPARPALPVPTLTHHHIMVPATSPQIPAAWSGIWSFTDSTYTCDNPVATSTSADFDTLCTGDTIDVTGFTCTGTISNTDVDQTCTETQTVYTGCDVVFTLHIQASRSGETYTSTTTLTSTSQPPGCYPDLCILTNTYATRVAPQPASCSSAALPTTWGGIKALYR